MLLSLGLRRAPRPGLGTPSLPRARLLLALLGVATALPAIVTVFAVTAIYGRAGIVNDGLFRSACRASRSTASSGILLAHVFFNASFAARVYLARSKPCR